MKQIDGRFFADAPITPLNVKQYVDPTPSPSWLDTLNANLGYQYKHYVKILERLINETGHSGASFAVCLRESIERILSENIIEATNISETDSDILTLEPIH